MARHFNYLGEITQAVAIALPSVIIGSRVDQAWPYAPYLSLLYPLYYVMLFIPRQIDDDAVCAKKYGKAWDEYVSAVPWRICPGVW